ncbi:MAG: inverse autotransporter beta domain-containing protein [Deltaproteobacteria bacterium]|jgi:hypothetical protein|nr:inverse autotransporter beta domain-containing protein [Deltaproteobacteria bacterium]
MNARHKILAVLFLILSVALLSTCADIRGVKPLNSTSSPQLASESQGGQSIETASPREPLELRPLEAPQGDPTGAYALKGADVSPSKRLSERRRGEFQLYNQLLSLMGLPGLFPTSQGDGGSSYRKARNYGWEERNPDGSYGRQSSTLLVPQLDQLPDRIMMQAMSAGAGAITTWAEGWFGGFGRAKINIVPNLNTGGITGSFDFLSPLYDSERMTLFTQIGLRTMPGQRIIGNMGLGQRWLWEDWALGYNVFLDQDFTRGHMRGGAGLELWYDWLRLAANYYKPLSKWMPSEDYEAEYIQERPAEGWDARVTGYLPFYRHLSITAAVEKWKGGYVAAFGHPDALHKNPTAYVLGVGWSPIPIISVDAQTRSYKGHSETQVGLTFNYMFGVPISEQIRPTAVAELATIDGSRHNFVQRQNEMILEYRATPGRYKIFVRKGLEPNTVTFTFYDGFGNKVTGVPVSFRG